MKKQLLPLVLLHALGLAISASAQILDRFDTGTSDWLVVDLDLDLPWSAPYTDGPYIPSHIPDGPASGHIFTSDPLYGPTFWFAAPSRYTGARASFYGSTISFRVKRNATLFIDDLPDLILVGGGVTLAVDAGPGPTANDVWTSYSIQLTDDAGWHRDTLEGPLATREDFMTVLANLQRFLVRGEFGGEPTDSCALDDVVLSEPISVEPPSLNIGFYPVVTIYGTPGGSYTIQSADSPESTDFTNVVTLVLPHSPYLFVDVASKDLPRRFYRAIAEE